EGVATGIVRGRTPRSAGAKAGTGRAVVEGRPPPEGCEKSGSGTGTNPDSSQRRGRSGVDRCPAGDGPGERQTRGHPKGGRDCCRRRGGHRREYPEIERAGFAPAKPQSPVLCGIDPVSSDLAGAALYLCSPLSSGNP